MTTEKHTAVDERARKSVLDYIAKQLHGVSADMQGKLMLTVSQAIESYEAAKQQPTTEKHTAVDAQTLGNLATHVASALGALRGYGHENTAAAKSLEHVQSELMAMYKAAKQQGDECAHEWMNFQGNVDERICTKCRQWEKRTGWERAVKQHPTTDTQQAAQPTHSGQVQSTSKLNLSAQPDKADVELVAEALFNHEQAKPFPPRMTNMALYGQHPVTWEFINDPMFVSSCSERYRDMARAAIAALPQRDSLVDELVEVLEQALSAFKCTQRVDDYPVKSWPQRARMVLIKAAQAKKEEL